MNLRRHSVLLVLLILTAAGCAGRRMLRDVQDPRHSMPKWYEEFPTDPDYILVPATATSRDLQMAVDKATQIGRAEIGSIFESHVERLFKELRSESGEPDVSEFDQLSSDASKTVVSDVLVGSRARKQSVIAEGPEYRAYVLVEMPWGPGNEALMSRIRSHGAFYNELKSTDALKELENEVQRYENWKRSGVVPGVAPEAAPADTDRTIPQWQSSARRRR